MSPSDRFKPIQRIASQKERKAAAALGESLKQREAARQRLQQLQRFLAEYQADFASAARNGVSSNRVIEYQAFISNLEHAIREQQQVVAQFEQDCDSSKQQWRGRYTKSKAMENAVDRMKVKERKDEDRREQSEADDRAQRKR
ncbi:MAG: flagellar export protein FliJ [Gammaproteobacteria bacterium]|nr:flagellar export protein FliJ [Gammaproteobacteria bacterium]